MLLGNYAFFHYISLIYLLAYFGCSNKLTLHFQVHRPMHWILRRCVPQQRYKRHAQLQVGFLTFLPINWFRHENTIVKYEEYKRGFGRNVQFKSDPETEGETL